MAINIVPIIQDLAALISLFNTGSIDSVAFFDQESFQQIFAEARPVKLTERPSAKLMTHPLENGQEIADFKIINPEEIEVTVIINSFYYGAMYSQIKNYFNNSTLIALGNRVGIANNLIISDIPHEETADMFDSITMWIRLREVLFALAPATFAPADPTADTPDDANFTSQVPQGQVTATTTSDLSTSQDFGFV
jgi:hypothetical protein